MDIDYLIALLTSVPIWATMTPIFICSIISVAVIIQRLVFYSKINYDYRDIVENVTASIQKKNIQDARAYIENYDGPLITVIGDILDSIKLKHDRQITIISSSRQAIASIERYVAVIATIATISPMLGFLGTVTGMLKGFTALYRMSAGTKATTLLAHGVAETLITTILGLLVAIPAWAFYNYMVRKVEYYINELEYISNIFQRLEK
jgi:biopolymer transport protein ExbB